MTGPRHLAGPRRRTAAQRIILTTASLLSLVLLAGAGVVGYLTYRFGQITRFDEVSIDQAPPDGPRNYLLVGSDSRAGLDEDDPANGGFFADDGSTNPDGPQRTDTIMILRVDAGAKTAQLLSFPRDLWVTLADRGDSQRINVAFTRGRDVLIDTIRENFGIPIHHYVEVNFVGFFGLVEAVGGVPFYFEDPVRDTHSGLSVEASGCVVLDARQGLALARSRHLEYYDADRGRWRSDPSGDLGRISRQQEFIRQSIHRAVSKGLSNPVTLNNLVNVGVENVGLDPSLTVGDILALGRTFAAFDADTLQTYSLPTTPFRTSGGAAVLDLVERQAEPIFNIFRGLPPDAVTPAQVEVTVVNGTDVDGFAGDITGALATVGFTTATPDTAEEPVSRTAVRYASGSEKAAAELARYLSIEPVFVVDDDLGANEVQLVAGPDFTTVHDQPSPTIPAFATTTTTTSTTVAEGEPSASTASTGSTTSTTAPIGYLPDGGRACT